MCQFDHNIFKKGGKDQESIQLSITPGPGYQWESDNLTIRHHKREPNGQLQVDNQHGMTLCIEGKVFVSCEIIS